MSLLRHRETRRIQRHAGCLTSVPFDQALGVISLYILKPICTISLVQQMQHWTRWGRGNVVALGGSVQSVAATWSVDSLMPPGVAERPEHGLRMADTSEIQTLAEHCRSRPSGHGSICGPARDVATIQGTPSE